MRIVRGIAALVLAAAAISRAGAVTIYGVTPANGLLRFDSATPGTTTTIGTLSGFGGGETVIGMDVRPLDGKLYVVTRTASSAGALYRVDTATAAATLVGSLAADPIDSTSPYAGLSGVQFGMDFNPAVDRIRLVSDSGLNARVNPTTGLVITDEALTYATGDPNVGAAPNIVGAAYTNNYRGATLTTLYDIDFLLDIVAIQQPPNAGFLTTVGPLGLNTGDQVGWDIAFTPPGETGFAGLTSGGVTRLYTINLATGAATLVGTIGGGLALTDLAAAIDVIFRNGFE